VLRDPRATDGRRISLTTAISTGLINGNSTVIDPRTGKSISLELALRQGTIDAKTGQFVDPSGGKLLSYEDAVKFGLFRLEGVGKGHPAGESGTYGDTSDGRVVDTTTGMLIGWDEACSRGIVDVKTGLYVDAKNGKTMSLDEAVEAELVVFDQRDLRYGTHIIMLCFILDIITGM